jgi:2-polyprenyl-3-methyl-5-hydroxy-6-metoxy-1,4-benzoquinol methylase
VNFFCIYLDLGANIGMFTLAVAAMGRKAKAVDATFKNLAFIR